MFVALNNIPVRLVTVCCSFSSLFERVNEQLLRTSGLSTDWKLFLRSESSCMNNTARFASEGRLSICARSVTGASSFDTWQSYAASGSEPLLSLEIYK